MKEITEKSETARLRRLYKNLPKNRKAVAEGLIAQAAGLRVRLNELNADIEANGLIELFSQSEKTEPYERERPAASLFIKLDKNYQAIIKQLTDMLPEGTVMNDKELAAFRRNS